MIVEVTEHVCQEDERWSVNNERKQIMSRLERTLQPFIVRGLDGRFSFRFMISRALILISADRRFPGLCSTASTLAPAALIGPISYPALVAQHCITHRSVK